MPTIQELVAENRIKDALKALRTIAGSREDEVILLQGRWSGLESQRTKGTISDGDGILQANQIKAAIISLLRLVSDDS